jgi:mRNA interferase RelE/StbE
MEILYSQKAEKQLKKIFKSDKENAVRIIQTIEEYAENPRGRFDVKILKGKMALFKRLRVGNYRIIFDENHNVLHIYQIKHRQESYK